MVTTPNCDTNPKASPIDLGQIQPWIEHASPGSVLGTPIIITLESSQFNHLMYKKLHFPGVEMLFQLLPRPNKKVK